MAKVLFADDAAFIRMKLRKVLEELGLEVVVMVSALGQESVVMQALQLGAVDFVAKPSGSISLDAHKMRDELVAKVKAAVRARLRMLLTPQSALKLGAAQEEVVGAISPVGAQSRGWAVTDRQIAQLSRLLELDLTAYHPSQLQRLLMGFWRRKGLTGMDGLLAALRRDTTLRQALLDSLGINITQFFRDPTMWVTLEREVLPDLLGQFKRLQVWSAGCSVGKEPYSLAAVLHRLDANSHHTILATDIDEAALEQARRAEYPADDLREIPIPYRALLTVRAERLVVPIALRKMVRFERLNLLRDTYPTGIHLLVCRNLLIYFRPEVKPRIFWGFARALVEGGVLFLGASEVLLSPLTYGFARYSSAFIGGSAMGGDKVADRAERPNFSLWGSRFHCGVACRGRQSHPAGCRRDLRRADGIAGDAGHSLVPPFRLHRRGHHRRHQCGRVLEGIGAFGAGLPHGVPIAATDARRGVGKQFARQRFFAGE